MKGLIRGAIAGGVCVAMVGFGGTAWAQVDEGEALPEQEITLGELEIGAERRAAKMMRMSAEERASFERLTRLKKSALPKLREMSRGL
jgi:predicted NUDIX family NTP pyrophosphohydrolase